MEREREGKNSAEITRACTRACRLKGRIDSRKCPPEKWGKERGEDGEREGGKKQRGNYTG